MCTLVLIKQNSEIRCGGQELAPTVKVESENKIPKLSFTVLEEDSLLMLGIQRTSLPPPREKLSRMLKDMKQFPTYLHHPSKHGGVVHCAAVPASVSELVLALFDARLRTFSDVLHMVLIQVAEFLLSLRKSSQLAAERLRSYDIYF